MENSQTELLSLLSKEGYTCEKALFLTYSLNPKTVFLSILKVLGIDDKKESKDIRHYMNQLLDKKIGIEKLKKKIAFVCNNGSDKDMDTPLGLYCNEFVYRVQMSNGGSFHPKLYILKMKKKDDETVETEKSETNNQQSAEYIYRIIVSTMNLTVTNTREVCVHFDFTSNESGQGRKGLDIVDGLFDIVRKSENESNTNTKSDETNCQDVCNRREQLSEFIEDLGLHKPQFKEEDLEQLEFLVFKGDGKTDGKPKLENTRDIISPFLTMRELDKLKDTTKIYTMDTELRKIGYKEVDEKVEANTEEFYIYSPQNTDSLFNHIKMYRVIKEEDASEWIYTGSLNYTYNALNKNKEILVGFPKNKVEKFYCDLTSEQSDNQTYVEGNYYKKYYKKSESSEAPDENSGDDLKNIKKKFKELARRVAKNSELEIVNNDQNNDVIINLKISELGAILEDLDKDYSIKISYKSLDGKKQSYVLKCEMDMPITWTSQTCINHPMIDFWLCNKEKESEEIDYIRLEVKEKEKDDNTGNVDEDQQNNTVEVLLQELFEEIGKDKGIPFDSNISEVIKKLQERTKSNNRIADNIETLEQMLDGALSSRDAKEEAKKRMSKCADRLKVCNDKTLKKFDKQLLGATDTKLIHSAGEQVEQLVEQLEKEKQLKKQLVSEIKSEEKKKNELYRISETNN